MGVNPVTDGGDWLDRLLTRAFPAPPVDQDELGLSYEQVCGEVDRARVDPARRAELDAIAGDAASIVDEARGDR
jgi:hypothetical protein